MIRWQWWLRRRRSVGNPLLLLSGNAVLARRVARSTPTARSLGLSVVCCRGSRVTRVYVVVLRRIRLVRQRVALVSGVSRLVVVYNGGCVIHSNCRPSFSVIMRERQQSQLTGNSRGRRGREGRALRRSPSSWFETVAGARSRKEIRRGWLTGTTTFGKWGWRSETLCTGQSAKRWPEQRCSPLDCGCKLVPWSGAAGMTPSRYRGDRIREGGWGAATAPSVYEK